MNVYDFDGTIYAGDSTVDFFIFALKSKPSIIRYVPKQISGFIQYELNRINKTQLKEYFFSFLSAIDSDKLVESFWETHHNKIYKWYLEQQEPEDIIISASPEFLLSPICRQLGIKHLIASKVNPHSGRFIGNNCRGQEKVRRLEKEYSIIHINKFYSDSKSDLPLSNIADEAFLVKKGVVINWKNTIN